METTRPDPTLIAKQITNVHDILVLRSLRNECSAYMTRDDSRIGVFRQLYWYFTVYKKLRRSGEASGFLFYTPMHKPIAYGLIFTDTKEKLSVLSGGVSLTYRGLGFGRKVFSFLTQEAKKKGTVSLEVLETNKVAHNLYLSLGFKDVGKYSMFRSVSTYPTKVIYMELPYAN